MNFLQTHYLDGQRFYTLRNSYYSARLIYQRRMQLGTNLFGCDAILVKKRRVVVGEVGPQTLAGDECGGVGGGRAAPGHADNGDVHVDAQHVVDEEAEERDDAEHSARRDATRVHPGGPSCVPDKLIDN
jgi:hypothetical protein